MLRRIVEAVAAALYPPRCVLCGAPTPSLQPVCRRCQEQLPLLSGPRCRRCGELLRDEAHDLCIPCGTQLRFVDRFLSLGPYDGPWGKLLRVLKFEREASVGRYLGRLAVESLRDNETERPIDCVTYVPMHRGERRQRGFNQARILAEELGHGLQVPVIRVLAKTRATQPQGRLSATDRRTNLKGAFRLLRCEGEHVLLVDDICTTGSTLEACAQVLKRGGIRFVTAITIARA